MYSDCSSGGRCLSVEYTDKVGELAKRHGLKLHIDGARIFNAAVVSTLWSSYNLIVVSMVRLSWTGNI